MDETALDGPGLHAAASLSSLSTQGLLPLPHLGVRTQVLTPQGQFSSISCSHTSRASYLFVFDLDWIILNGYILSSTSVCLYIERELPIAPQSTILTRNLREQTVNI